MDRGPENTFFSSRKREQAFIEWFCENPSNGDELIHKLNAYYANQFGNERNKWYFIRRERFSPFIYGIVLNLENEFSDKLFSIVKEHDGDIRLMKVGHTRVHAEEDDANSRSREVKRNIKKKLKDYGIQVGADETFQLRVNCQNSRKDRVVEEEMQNILGFPMKSNVATKLKLPYPTEWIFTSKRVIEGIENKIDEWEEVYNGGGEVTRVLTTEVFTSFEYENIDPLLQGNAEALQKVLESM